MEPSLPLKTKITIEEVSKILRSPSKGHSEIFGEKKEIGKGSFGKVFEVSFQKEGVTKYAAKETISSSNLSSQISDLIKEKIILQSLLESEGFPRVENFIKDENKEILVMTLLGPNLDNLRHKCTGERFSLKTVLMIGIQAIRRIEALHEQGFVHRDIKPANFVIGVGSTKNIIHLIDFGLSKAYWNKEKKHVKFSTHNPIEGTPYYLSVYGHLGLRPSRRDDLISLGFTLLHLYFGKMPWDDVQGDFDERMQSVCKKKATTSAIELCQGLPDEFVTYFDYVLKLLFQIKPDYQYLIGLFQKVMDREGFKNDGIFDWDITLNQKKGIDLNAKRFLFKPLSNYVKQSPNINEELDY